jgi:hypothetical protein
MRRIWALTVYVTRDFFRSLACIVPLAAALAFGLIAFEYGMDQAQFITVAGIGIGAISLTTTLLLASRTNRATSYLLVARLQGRWELLAALGLSSLGITALLALLIAAGNLAAGRLTLDFPSALWIVPTWLALWLLSTALAFPLSALVGQGGSHLAGFFLLALLLVGNERRAWLQGRGLDWAVKGINAVLWPVSTLLSQASAGLHGRTYMLSGLLTLSYAGLLFLLAVSLLGQKDLIWAE